MYFLPDRTASPGPDISPPDETHPSFARDGGAAVLSLRLLCIVRTLTVEVPPSLSVPLRSHLSIERCRATAVSSMGWNARALSHFGLVCAPLSPCRLSCATVFLTPAVHAKSECKQSCCLNKKLQERRRVRSAMATPISLRFQPLPCHRKSWQCLQDVSTDRSLHGSRCRLGCAVPQPHAGLLPLLGSLHGSWPRLLKTVVCRCDTLSTVSL